MYIKKTFEEMESDSYIRAREQLLEAERLNDDQFMIHNLETGCSYIVSINYWDTSCTCPHHKYRGVRCKHIIRAFMELGEIV